MLESIKRRRLAPVALSAALLMLGAQEPGEAPSALESEPAGWSDLLAPSGAGLDAWTREPIPAGGDLVEDSPWKLDAASGVLSGSSPGADREWLRLDQVLLDFILHVEWRIVPGPAAAPASGGVYFRNSNDAGLWHEARLGAAGVGSLVGATYANQVVKPFSLDPEGDGGRARPAGEWNTYELNCKGRSVSLWINGSVARGWKGCGVPRGYIGLEVDGGRVEFRNLKLKPL